MPPTKRTATKTKTKKPATPAPTQRNFVERNPYLTAGLALGGLAAGSALYRHAPQLRLEVWKQFFSQPADEALPAGLSEADVQRIAAETMAPLVTFSNDQQRNLAAMHHMVGRILTDGVKIIGPDQYQMLSQQALDEVDMANQQWQAYAAQQ